MQALMLAAGMGRRLGKYTKEVTKCMIQVGGKTLLERTVDALKDAGITRFVMVVGWEADTLIEYIRNNIHGMDFTFVRNENYATTNNIYSLYLARDYLQSDDTLLLESDLIYDRSLLAEIVNDHHENVAAVAPYEPWMDGTVTLLSEDGYVRQFVSKRDFSYDAANQYFKTVNIYKFSKDFSCHHYLPFLEAYIKAYGTNQYYETVLKVLAHISNSKLSAFVLKNTNWYEIDDVQDLDIANTIFSNPKDCLQAYSQHFGGCWRFPRMKDFCYLVNPYYPSARMMEQMKYSFRSLLTQYPSGMKVQRLVAGKTFHVEPEYLLVGNGAAELINAIGQILFGNLVVTIPGFHEYIRCFSNCNIKAVETSEDEYNLRPDKILSRADDGDTFVLVNPDNPSGSFVDKNTMLGFLESCAARSITCILDESFADFVEREKRYTLLSNEILEKFPNLIVVKSISKSYGVPGLRLGIAATSNQDFLQKLERSMPIWNINSFGEHFLQIASPYKSDYEAACDKIVENRQNLFAELQSINFLTPYPSQANYIMCEVHAPWTAKKLTQALLQNDNILIKDLSEKDGFHKKDFVRFAVKDRSDNRLLIQSLCGLDT